MSQSLIRPVARVQDATEGGRFVNLRGFPWGALTKLHWGQVMFWLLGPLFALAITSQWFPPGRLIAGGDNFPTDNINPANWLGRVRYVWDVASMGGPGSPALLLPPIVANRLLRVVLSPADTQHAYFALIFAGQFLAMLLFSLTIFPQRRIGAYCAALFYCFNPFVVLGLPTWFSMFVLFYLPYMAALFVRVVTRPLTTLRLAIFALSASISGVMFVNPPTYAIFLSFACAVVGYVLIRHRRDPKVWQRMVSLVVLFSLANAYWAAQVYFGLFGAGHQQVSAVTNSADIGGVSARSSILNLFWLNPIWAWGGYLFSRAYDSPLLLATIFMPVALAFSSLLNNSIPRRIVLPAASATLLLLLLSTGQHDPWANINLFIYHHVPLFWLFREPDGKFPYIVLILYAPLIGYQAEWLSDRAAVFVRDNRLFAKGFRTVIVALIGLAFIVSAFPLVTGAVVGRGYVSPDKVGIALPSYWFQLADYLSGHNSRGRVLLLPNDDFYQMPYTWGYYGADNVASEFLPNAAVILSGSGGTYTTASSSYDAFAGKMLRLLQANSNLALAPYLAALNIGYIVQRNDIDTTSLTRHIVPPQQVRAYLHAQQGVSYVRSFGRLDLYVVDRQQYVPSVYTIPLPANALSASGRQQVADRQVTAALALPRGQAMGSAPVHRPQIGRPAFSEQNATRLVVQVDPTAGPILLVLSTLYHLGWHACIVPAGTSVSPLTCWTAAAGVVPARDHVQPLGFLNGWVIDHPGRYTVVVDYEPQHAADVAALLSACVVGSLLFAALWSLILLFIRRVRSHLWHTVPTSI